MDIKTIINLLTAGQIEATKAVELIAIECDTDPAVLITALKKINTTKTSTRFSPQEIASVISMWQNGATKGQIAKQLGRDRISINNLIARLRKKGIDLPLRPIRTADNQLTLF
jgi:hypothetical protein